MIYDLLLRTRTIRHFKRDCAPTRSELEKLVRCARLVPSAANRQRIRYAFLLGDAADAAFRSVAFAGYLPPEKRPGYEDRAPAYVVLMSDLQNPDTHVSMDIGIAAQAVVMAARELGYGACMIRSFKQSEIAALVGDTPDLYPNLVIALGADNEEATVVDIKDGDIKYYKDENDVNVVPKRTVSELIVN